MKVMPKKIVEEKMTSHRKSGLDKTQIPLILDRIPVAITVTDPDGKILYYNEHRFSRQFNRHMDIRFL